MLTKSALLEIDPDTRAFTLVGAFMGHFALLETGIGAALGEVVGLNGARRVIINRKHRVRREDQNRTHRGPEPECQASKADGRTGYAVAAFEGPFLLLIIACELCAQIGKMEGSEAGPQAEALINQVGK
ncbi:hypothetical protein [Mesorhizobium sp. M0522]|uniref:hypothetical protein n=1 Tax=Mesorhizobium sp. M0522 TaxID=2956958 RepID=UPI00333DD57E